VRAPVVSGLIGLSPCGWVYRVGPCPSPQFWTHSVLKGLQTAFPRNIPKELTCSGVSTDPNQIFWKEILFHTSLQRLRTLIMFFFLLSGDQFREENSSVFLLKRKCTARYLS